MKTVTSVSGGMTSAYVAANYPSDYYVFALVTTNDKKLLYPDAKLRQIVSDKIGKEFIGTLEDNIIIHTILDLEQYIGKEINWVVGKPFDEIIIRKDNVYLPNKTQRFCTTEMKLRPIFNWWYVNINEIVQMQIGYRANEERRANNMLSKVNMDGLLEFKETFEKKNGRNKWSTIAWQKPIFPLIEHSIYKEDIVNYWNGKKVRFAIRNNCVGCFHRNPLLLKKMWNDFPDKMQWFANKEIGKSNWRSDVSYNKIKTAFSQINLFDDDFSDCDSGYCGL
jgi:hypothetical protein